MRNFTFKGAVLILVCAVLCSFIGCGKAPEVSQATRQRQEELTADFVEEIKYVYLPAKDDEAMLEELGVPLVTRTASFNTAGLESFYEAWQDNDNTAVTMVFANTSFVVTRLVFEGGYGYYMRFQYDSGEGAGSLPVSNTLIDSVGLERDDTLNKIELTIFKDEVDIAKFSFKSIRDMAEPQVDEA